MKLCRSLMMRTHLNQVCWNTVPAYNWGDISIHFCSVTKSKTFQNLNIASSHHWLQSLFSLAFQSSIIWHHNILSVWSCSVQGVSVRVWCQACKIMDGWMNESPNFNLYSACKVCQFLYDEMTLRYIDLHCAWVTSASLYKGWQSILQWPTIKMYVL